MIQPDLLLCVVCDDVRREENGKWILIGLFEHISVAHFPVHHAQICVFNKWTGGSGSFTQQTRFVDEDDRVLLSSDALSFELAELDTSFTAVQTFSGLPLERPGKIWVEILLGDELKQRFALRIDTLRG